MWFIYSEVVLEGDGTGGTLALADGPVLGESAGTGDGGLVGALVGAHGVCGAVRSDGSELGHTRRARIITAVAITKDRLSASFHRFIWRIYAYTT
jgi:hypothetical protein